MGDKTDKKIVVMGYLCLDLFPEIKETGFTEFKPGMLRETGPCRVFPGGVVGNTGIALHKLGIPVKLVGRIGNDMFGQMLHEAIINAVPESALYIKVTDGNTAYCVVLSPIQSDRLFLAYRGVNDSLEAADVDDAMNDNVALLHFGYPPLCLNFMSHSGKELKSLFRNAASKGIITSLDMSLPSSGSPGYSINWISFLTELMPLTDIFLPSFDELVFMLKPQAHGILAKLREMTDVLLELKGGIVAVKLGADGLYVRCSDDINRLEFLSTVSPQSLNDWQGREFLVPCREAEVVGTTGAGDAAVAGFLAGIVKGDSPENVGLLAVSAGACSVTSFDAVSGMKPLTMLRQMLRQGWSAEELSFCPENIPVIN